MSKKIIKIIFVALVLSAFFAVFLLIKPQKEKENEIKEINDEINQMSLTELSPEQQLAKMSLEEKVGQMLMVGFWGTEPDYYINKMINERGVGGVILMKYNIEDREQLVSLIKDLQEKSEKNSGIPLFIAVDQEGGEVSRVKVEGVSEFTTQAEIENPEKAEEIASNRAKELKALGINLNFSPVLDIVNDRSSFLYSRTFQKDLEQTKNLGAAMIKGYQESIIAVPKHFLGHPDSTVDPHASEIKAGFSLPQIEERAELFRQIFVEASPKMVMTSHVTYEAIDPDHPCSLSKVCVTQWLKEKAGYSPSVIITDDMEMGAIQEQYSNGEAAVMAVNAGNDILLYVSSPEKQAEAYNAIVEAVNNGQISTDRINESVLKILELKKEYFTAKSEN